MDHPSGSDFPSVYHGLKKATIEWPKPFVLLDYVEEENCDREVIKLYGMRLPNGVAATVRPDGMPNGKWEHIERLAERLGLELVWLEPKA